MRVLAGEPQLNVAVHSSLARRLDNRGRLLPSMPSGLYVVRPGEFWLLSRHALSFDSRYFGPVPASTILAVLPPVWIFGR